MKKLLTVIFILLSTSIFAQTEHFAITYNKFSKLSPDSVAWYGTDCIRFVKTRFLVTYCIDCPGMVIIDGYIVYRKYFSSYDCEDIYWDIDYFADKYKDPLKQNTNVLGFKQE